MARDQSAQSKASRRAVQIAALAGWLTVILVAAGREVDTAYWIGLPDMSDFVSVLWLITLVVGSVLILRSSRTTALPPQATRRGRWFMWAVMALLLVVVATDPDFLDRFRLDPDENELTQPEEIVDESSDEAQPPPDVQIEAWHVYIALAVLGGVTVFLRWNRRRLDDEQHDEIDATDDDLITGLAAMVDRAGAELARHGEPRMRVMTAYAEVERALAERRMARRPTETPSEHIRRVLSVLPIDPSPLVDLGSLYELARFSDHPITDEDQHRSAAALDRTRRELADLPEGGHRRAAADPAATSFTSGPPRQRR